MHFRFCRRHGSVRALYIRSDSISKLVSYKKAINEVLKNLILAFELA